MKKINPYKPRLLLLMAAFISLLWSCKTSEGLTMAETEAKLDALVTLLENQSYTIDVETVRPFNTAATTQVLNKVMLPRSGNSASRIDVNGSGYYLSVEEGIASASLPFFGEQRQGGGHYGSSDSGIAMDNELKDYKVLPHTSKNRVIATFTAKDKNRRTESYDVNITAFPGGRAVVAISSSHRTTISYSGTLKSIDETTTGKKL